MGLPGLIAFRDSNLFWGKKGAFVYIFEKVIDDVSIYNNAIAAVCGDVAPEKTMFFDIETTGLSATRSGLYLIGCMFGDGRKIIIRQYFSDGWGDEKEMLEAFEKEVKQRPDIIDFNGSTFDIPFLKTKYEQHKMKHPFEDACDHDIYRMVTPLKKIFSLKSLKQKSLEEFAGVFREDKYTGGELIEVYKNYQKRVLLKNAAKNGLGAEEEEMRRLLLLHNSDDMAGMLTVAGLVGVFGFFKGDFEIVDKHEGEGCLSITLRPDVISPLSDILKRGVLPCVSAVKDGLVCVDVPIRKGNLRLFINDYKNHFYVPSKDMAIHASVAGFLPGCEKIRAKKENCYVPCNGTFLPIKAKHLPSNFPIIKEAYADETAYIKLEDADERILREAIICTLRSVNTEENM